MPGGPMAHQMGPGNPAFRGTAMPMRVTSAKIQRHDAPQPVSVNLDAGPSGLANNVDNLNPMAMAERDYAPPYGAGAGMQPNVCAQSINSDVFSQFSMPSNNLIANQMNANNIGGAFSMTNMSQTGPRLKRTIDGEDLQAPLEIYSREKAGAPPPNVMIPRSGISESQSDFNSGIQSLNARANTGGTLAGMMGQGVAPGNFPLSMGQSNYDNDMNA